MFSLTADVRTLRFCEKLPRVRLSAAPVNKRSLGELLVGFMHYYGFMFDYAQMAVSVRVGACLVRDPSNGGW
jgi:DNA polymerase sigma